MQDLPLTPVPRDSSYRISVCWPGGSALVCRVQFHKTQLFVHFPYHPDSDGALGRIDQFGDSYERTVSHSTGWGTKHKVKYSHPRNGNCHFSQDYRIRSDVRNMGAPLAPPDSHIFSLTIAGLSLFKPAALDGSDGAQVVAILDAPLPPTSALTLVGRWLSPGSLTPSVDSLQNPFLLERPQSSVPRFGMGVAPPDTSPLAPGLLCFEPIVRPLLGYDATVDPFVMVFIGGITPNSCIYLRYPVDVTSLPSIDYFVAAQ